MIKPFVPQALTGDRSLSGFDYRGAKLNISVSGFGDKVSSITLNGKPLDPEKVIPAKALAKGGDIVVRMNNEPIAPMKINRVANKKAPLTPATWMEVSADMGGDQPLPLQNLLRWNPIEYIGEYIVLKDGVEVGRTHKTEWPALTEGEWQVIGVAGDGTQGFASEPRSNRFFAETFEFPGEKPSGMLGRRMLEPEGYRGNGFVAVQQDMDAPAVEVELPEGGTYSVAVRYANGEGPINTENKAAVRSLLVDGVKAGTLVLPQRGVDNWDDWGMSNGIAVELTPGWHTLQIVYLPEDENMNIKVNRALLDRIVLEKLK